MFQCKQPPVSRHIATPVSPFPSLSHSLQSDLLPGGCSDLPPIRTAQIITLTLRLLYSCLYAGWFSTPTPLKKGLCEGFSNWHNLLFMSFWQSDSLRGRARISALWQSAPKRKRCIILWKEDSFASTLIAETSIRPLCEAKITFLKAQVVLSRSVTVYFTELTFFWVAKESIWSQALFWQFSGNQVFH